MKIIHHMYTIFLDVVFIYHVASNKKYILHFLEEICLKFDYTYNKYYYTYNKYY